MTDEQREQVTYDYDDETKTTSWSNFRSPSSTARA
ncbi:hypothetical protein [Gordonia terrae]|nr:hypothetical protein [Gordonia terrae]